jgi:ribonuclease P protein component
LKFTQSLNKNFEFHRLYNKGKSAASPLLVIYCRKNGRKFSRLGLTVSKKVGKAVHRNKLRRRLREAYRIKEASFACGWDIAVVARIKSRFASYAELSSDFYSLAARLGLFAFK